MKVLINFISIAALAFILASCEANEPEQKDDAPEQTMWEEVSEFSNINVRFVKKNDNVLFIAGMDLSDKKGVLYKTTDGKNWEFVKKFSSYGIGPIAFNNDTLYILADSLYRYTPENKLSSVCYYPTVNPGPAMFSDMAFLKGRLYIIVSTFICQTYRLSFDGTCDTLAFMPGYTYSYGGATFIKNPKIPDDVLYVRPYYYNPQFYVFDGDYYSYFTDGLTESEKKNCVMNSMVFKDGTLYAGFNYPSAVKKLNGNIWQEYTKPIPQSEYHTWTTETTALTFYNERLFASTNFFGVLEWRGDSAWVSVSDGLQKDMELSYNSVVFLENFKGSLFAAYGAPAHNIIYMEYEAGVYKLDINKIK